MLRVKIQKKKNMKDGTSKYYVQSAGKESTYSLSDIVKGIEKTSTVSSADVKAVLDALQTEVIAALQNGASVRLGDLGSFHTTIASKGATDETTMRKNYEDYITRIRVQFTPSKAMKKAFALGDAKEVKLSLQTTQTELTDSEDPNA